MAKKDKKNIAPEADPKLPSVSLQSKTTWGIFLMLLAVALFLAYLSFFIYWREDQSTIHVISDRNFQANNWLGKIGAWVSHVSIYQGFGVSMFLLVRLLFVTGLALATKWNFKNLQKTWFWDLYAIAVLSVAFGFFANTIPELGGVVGYEFNDLLKDYIGSSGTGLIIVFLLVVYLVYKIQYPVEKIQAWFTKKEKPTPQETVLKSSEEIGFKVEEATSLVEKEEKKSPFEINKEELKPTIANASEISWNPKEELVPEEEIEPVLVVKKEEKPSEVIELEEGFVIEQTIEEEAVEENLAAKLVADFGEFDPTLELSNYKFPTIDLLKDYAGIGITINQEELEENKNRIVDTLRNYKIDIAQIKATVGPTVTLYEIVPEAGIRISKIKSLEDDIALSLSALGIRIIAPIPGKGTIGIEVPNQKPTMVPMRTVISSPKFQEAEMELPIALGKTISNETFVFDLAKMPHLLMAGATGQGKSVGLNAVLTSLLYKKHPAEVKFVLVDPKKVELTLFNKIERHYLAKLPDTEEAIITDTSKVINTLNSLCIEMDDRYSLLKDAMVRNIKEYNQKFKMRKLNPNEGHRFLPYIVLVVDEFADLIMTAGKEVETPIARLAQLARAIGIHLIIATQRPSVNVITGLIKANFPARIAFRVSSKIDSRTILDTQGADQLIGKGDLLYTNGNDMVRVQCAFVDTPEVEKITEFIGSQKAYARAYQLPEYVGEDGGTVLDIDISERDSMFREAAEVIVTAQQGSASLLQRKLKLGYNRAGRIIDQLEAAGIVGPFEGSKARSVNFPDLKSLHDFLDNEQG